MTFSPKVWCDALRRLQNDIPEFVFDAWIAPLAAKVDEGRLVLGCPTSFHRDRILRHHVDSIERACCVASAEVIPVDVLTMAEFGEARGVMLETRIGMQRVGVAPRALAVNGANVAEPDSRTGPTDATNSIAGAGTSAPVQTDPVVEPRVRLHAVPNESIPAKRAARVRNDAARNDANPLPPAGPAMRSANGSDPRVDLGPAFGLDGKPRGREDAPYTFENFVVGPCNSLAREATLALARRRQQSLNLLYLGGLSGMGKSHLARAAADEVRQQLPERPQHARLQSQSGPPRARAIYVTAEQFTSEFVSAMRNGRNDAWASRYRGPIEFLVVEDIQVLTGRTKTQLELANTIAHVLDAGGRVLLTGDRTPRDLTGLDERLRSIVGRGFIAELDRPDALVRRHILRAKAAAGGVSLPANCLELLVDASESESVGASVTDLESLLIQVVTTSSLLGRSVDAALVREAIDLKTGANGGLAPRQIDVTEIVQIVAGFFGARAETLASRSRRRDVLVPRQLAMYLAHRYTNASQTEIGRALGRDHPSVRNAITRIERQVLENAPLRYQVEALSERIDRELAKITRD